MNPEQWLSLKWNGGSTMSDRWLNQSKIIQEICQKIKNKGEEWNACIFNNGTQKYTTT